MKKVLLITLSYLAVNVSVAQSDKQLTHYMFDKMSFNPAMTGFKGYCATAIYRGQWDKVENAPNTMLLNFQGSLPNFPGVGGSGIGLSFMNDVVGLGKEMEIKLNYAYHYHAQSLGFLSAGIGLGIENIGFDPKWNAPMTGTNIALDPLLPQGASGTKFDVNFGLHWKGQNTPYFVGLSAAHITQPNLENVNFQKARNYYVIGGIELGTGIFPLMPDNLKITPSFLFKTDAVAGILDFNVMADFWFGPRGSETAGLYGGLTYRTKDAIAILIGFQKELYTSPSGKAGTLKAVGQPDVLKIGYSYDIMTGPLNQYGGGSHELVFNYCMFAPPPPVQRYGNVFILQ